MNERVNMAIKSLGQAIILWGEKKDVRNTRLVSLLKSAFRIYVLPNLGYEFITGLSLGEFSTFCYEVKIINLEYKKVLEIFDQTFDQKVKAGDVSARTKGNYRSAINKFFNWLQTQSWYLEEFSASKPIIYPGKVSAKQKPPRTYSGERHYALKEEDLTPFMRQDLKRYEEF